MFLIKQHHTPLFGDPFKGQLIVIRDPTMGSRLVSVGRIRFTFHGAFIYFRPLDGSRLLAKYTGNAKT